MPVVLAADRVEGPVRLLGVDEDDPRLRRTCRRCRTTRRSRRTARPGRCGEAWNHGCWSLVWFMTRSAMTRMPRLCASSTSSTKSPMLPYSGRIAHEVGDVVAAVAQRGGVDRQQPDAVDAQPLQVVQPGDQPASGRRCRRRWNPGTRGRAPRRTPRACTTRGSRGCSGENESAIASWCSVTAESPGLSGQGASLPRSCTPGVTVKM